MCASNSSPEWRRAERIGWRRLTQPHAPGGVGDDAARSSRARRSPGRPSLRSWGQISRADSRRSLPAGRALAAGLVLDECPWGRGPCRPCRCGRYDDDRRPRMAPALVFWPRSPRACPAGAPGCSRPTGRRPAGFCISSCRAPAAMSLTSTDGSCPCPPRPARCCSRPRQGENLVPVLAFCAHAGVQAAPGRMMAPIPRMSRRCQDLGLPHSPCCAAKRRPGHRHAAGPSWRHEGRLLAADEGPRPGRSRGQRKNR
jgi:hypothetical protein